MNHREHFEAFTKLYDEFSQKRNEAMTKIEEQLQSWLDKGVSLEYLQENIEIYEKQEPNEDGAAMTYTIGLRFKGEPRK